MRTETETITVTKHYCDVGEWIGMYLGINANIEYSIGVVTDTYDEYMKVWFPMKDDFANVRYEYKMDTVDKDDLIEFFKELKTHKVTAVVKNKLCMKGT